MGKLDLTYLFSYSRK